MDALEIIASFIITWGVGLGPALAARYLISKKPLKPRAATWIAGLTSIFFFVAFRVVLALVGAEEPGPGIVWVLVFFVSRWIMTRGYHDGLTAKIEERLKQEGLSESERLKLEAARARFKK